MSRWKASDEDGHLALATATPEGLEVHARVALLSSAAWTPPTLVGTTPLRHLRAFDGNWDTSLGPTLPQTVLIHERWSAASARDLARWSAAIDRTAANRTWFTTYAHPLPSRDPAEQLRRRSAPAG